MIQPNAQVCRRLAGASLECRPSFLPFLATLQSVGRSGRVPPRCPLLAPPRPDRSSPRTELPYGPRRGTARLQHPPLPSPITARKRKCERGHGRASERSGAVRSGHTTGSCVGNAPRVCTCVYAPVDDATSRPLMAISAAGHQRVPTGPNRPGQLAASVTFARARVPLTCLSLFLFFLIFLPLLLRATLSRGAQRPFLFVSSFFFFFLSPAVLSSRPPPFAPIPRCSVKIMLRARERYFSTFGNQYGIFRDNVRRPESLKM